jgi:hypothetical protein
MANLSSNRTVNYSRNTDTNLQSSVYLNYPNLSSPNVDRNSIQLPNNLSDNPQPNNFTILHQNICGIFHKTDEFLTSLTHTCPHVLCLTEHHLRIDELKNINLGQYTLGAQYCRQFYINKVVFRYLFQVTSSLMSLTLIILTKRKI